MSKKYEIKSQKGTFPASEYQCKIFECIETGIGNLLINAAAGASKTTTIVNAIRYIPENKKVLFIAFNKDIVASMAEQVTHPKAKVSTFHSLGFTFLKDNGIIGTNTENVVNEYKYRAYINANIQTISEYGETKTLGKKYTTYVNNICKLVDYSRYYLAFTEKEIKRVAETYSVIPVRDEIEVTNKVLKWGKEHIETIDYTDMIWLPNVLNLLDKKLIFDWIFIDEAQDSSVCEQELIERCFKRGTRFAAVFDEHQQINVWCGSSEDAIQRLKQHANTHVYTLPISYRCPKSVIKLAQQYSPNIIPMDNASEGKVNYDVDTSEIKPGDMVLCRQTSPLITLYMQFLKDGKQAYIRGSENIHEDYMRMVTVYNSTLIDKSCVTSDGLFPKMYKHMLNEIDRMIQVFGVTEEDAILSQNIQNLYDAINGLSVLSEGLTRVDDLVKRINTVFSKKETDNVIQLSTVHKAKGLECDNVFILRPSLMPSRMCTKEWEWKTENNLIYVAYTRAKETLNFLKEESSILDSNTIESRKRNINLIKAKIKYASENKIAEKEIERYTLTSHTITLGATKAKSENTSTKKGGLKFAKLLKK